MLMRFQEHVIDPYKKLNAKIEILTNTHCCQHGITVKFPGNVFPVGFLIAIRKRYLFCLLVPANTSQNQTSGCIVTWRIIESVAIDTNSSIFPFVNRKLFLISKMSASKVLGHLSCCSFDGRPRLV